PDSGGGSCRAPDRGDGGRVAGVRVLGVLVDEVGGGLDGAVDTAGVGGIGQVEAGELLDQVVVGQGQVVGVLGLAAGCVGQAIDLVAAAAVDEAGQSTSDHAALLFA